MSEKYILSFYKKEQIINYKLNYFLYIDTQPYNVTECLINCFTCNSMECTIVTQFYIKVSSCWDIEPPQCILDSMRNSQIKSTTPIAMMPFPFNLYLHGIELQCTVNITKLKDTYAVFVLGQKGWVNDLLKYLTTCFTRRKKLLPTKYCILNCF